MVGVGVGGVGFFPAQLYSCMFLLSVYRAVAPRISAIVKSDFFLIFYCDSLSIAACVSFVKLYYLKRRATKQKNSGHK